MRRRWQLMPLGRGQSTSGDNWQWQAHFDVEESSVFLYRTVSRRSPLHHTRGYIGVPGTPILLVSGECCHLILADHPEDQ